MFCTKCGKPTEGDKRLCPACEAAHDAALQPANPKKKKNALLAVIASVLAVAIVFTTLGFACWDWGGSLAFSWAKLTKDGKGAALYIEEKALKENGIPLLSEGYGRLVNTSGATATTLRLQVGDPVVDMIVDNADAEDPALVRQLLAVLQNIRITIGAGSADGVAQTDILLGLNDVDVLALRLFADYMTGDGFVGLPELNDTYLAFDLEENGLNTDQMLALMEASEELTRNLPDEESFNKLISRYVLVALSSLEDVDESIETEDVDGVKQKLTVYTYRIDEAAARDMLIAVLKEAENDGELKALVNAFCRFCNAYGETTGEYYEEIDADALFDSLPALIEELEDMETDRSNGAIRIKTYVNSAGRICGRSMRFPDDTQVSFLATLKGNKLGFRLFTGSGEDMMELTGSGEVKGGALSGRWRLRIEDVNVATIELDRLDVESFTGTLRIKPSADLRDVIRDAIDEIDGLWASLLQDGDLEIQIGLGENATDISLKAGSDMLLKLGISTQEKDAVTCQIPEEYTYCTSEEEAAQWVAQIDLTALLDKLEQAGVPKEILDIIEQKGFNP